MRHATPRCGFVRRQAFALSADAAFAAALQGFVRRQAFALSAGAAALQISQHHNSMTLLQLFIEGDLYGPRYLTGNTPTPHCVNLCESVSWWFVGREDGMAAKEDVHPSSTSSHPSIHVINHAPGSVFPVSRDLQSCACDHPSVDWFDIARSEGRPITLEPICATSRVGELLKPL